MMTILIKDYGFVLIPLIDLLSLYEFMIILGLSLDEPWFASFVINFPFESYLFLYGLSY